MDCPHVVIGANDNASDGSGIESSCSVTDLPEQAKMTYKDASSPRAQRRSNSHTSSNPIRWLNSSKE